jgi:hypothetical protein
MGKFIKGPLWTLKNQIKIIGIYITIFTLFSGCNDGIKPEEISSKFGTTWYYQDRLSGHIHSDTLNKNYRDFNGVIIYSSGLVLNINYNRSSGIETIRRLCFDCGDPIQFKDEYCEWRLTDNVLIISKNDWIISKDKMYVINKDTVMLINENDTDKKDTCYMIRVRE